jgi:hypothetical protein
VDREGLIYYEGYKDYKDYRNLVDVALPAASCRWATTTTTKHPLKTSNMTIGRRA